MSWLDRSEHQLEGGYWGEVTSTLLWCEQKYQWSKYLAEPVNSLTNALFLACAAYAMYRVHTERLHARFYGCALGVGAVGVGSLLFHMTLKHEAQLLDELPMIWASSFLTWSFLDQTLFLGTRIDRRVLPAIIFALNVWITVTYMSNGDPVFHQVAYASIMVVSILHAIYILTHPKAPLNTSDSARRRRHEARSRVRRQRTVHRRHWYLEGGQSLSRPAARRPRLGRVPVGHSARGAWLVACVYVLRRVPAARRLRGAGHVVPRAPRQLCRGLRPWPAVPRSCACV